MRAFVFTFLLTLFLFIPAGATTWNEPWHEQVVKTADSFVKAKITEAEGKTATGEIMKQLGGATVPAQFKISGFWQLQLGSISSGSGELGLPFRKGETYYIFLKKSDKDDSFQIATPTASYAILKDGYVTGTYRHSYHRGIFPEDVYEKTMAAIFQHAKGQPYDKAYIESFVKEQLSLPVSNVTNDMNADESKRFFLQHAAMETIYHTGAGADLKMLKPFLESSVFHAQISAARAISSVNSAESKETLMKYIEGDGVGFARVMGVWGLKRLNAKEMKPRLETFLKSGKDEKTGFGGSIMDPRVGTYFPGSVKNSVEGLLAEWAKG